MANQQNAERLSALDNDQLNQQNLYNPGRVPNLDKEDLGDDDLINLANRRHAAGVVAPVNQNHPFR